LSTFETIATVVMWMLLFMWIALVVGAIVIIWKIRKAIIGVTVAVGAVIETTRIVTGTARAIGAAARGAEKRVG
jgi:hypothetical protein